MAGHSKWNNIKNRKGAVDAKRGKIFAQVAKQIRVAVKEGNSADPKSNPALRTALDKARAENMPKDNIQRAINKGLGKTADGATIQEILYEGFGPHGVAVMVSAVTDNTNRTSSEIRFAFSKSGGSLGGPGSAQYMFTKNQDSTYTATLLMELTPDQQADIAKLVDLLQENEDVEEIYLATNLN